MMSSPPTATPYDQSVAKLLVQKLNLDPGIAFVSVLQSKLMTRKWSFREAMRCQVLHSCVQGPIYAWQYLCSFMLNLNCGK